jgi:lysozyme family protein
MTRFDECVAFVFDHEGIDAPDDGDNLPDYGITQSIYNAWRRSQKLPEQPIGNITKDEAKQVYHDVFWVGARCDDLQPPLDLIHFDSAVNLGISTATRMLQTALGFTVTDGVMGPRTVKAANESDRLVTAVRYLTRRLLRYSVLSAQDAKYRRYLRGWSRRVADLLRLL